MVYWIYGFGQIFTLAIERKNIMPGFRTHYLFGKTADDEYHLNQHYPAIKVHPHAYQLGQQGPDIFFYYIPSIFFYPKNIGTVMHNRDVMSFFAALFEARSSILSGHSRQIADAYIMGFIGHYTLDVTAHPYIQYRTKKTKLTDRPKFAHGNHVFLETDIDVALQQHYLHLPPSDFKAESTIVLSRQELSVISRLLARAIKNTYPDLAVPAWQIRLAIKSTYLITAFCFDPHGQKKKWMRFIDQRLFHHAFYSPIIANDNFNAFRDPLNLRHLQWVNPWDERLSSKKDFYELLDDARHIFVKRLDMYDRMLRDAGMNPIVSRKARQTLYFHRLNALLAELGDYSYSKGVMIK